MFLSKRTQAPATMPLFPFEGFRQQMDRLFDDWANGGLLAGFEANGTFNPQVDVIETEKELKVTAELPGLEQKDVEVELANDRLVLKGKKNQEKEEKTDTWYRRERSFGSFERMIALPWEASAEKVKADATFKNGILTVTVARPKEAQERSQKLEIKAA